jgi:hypothetical protein
MVLLNGLYRFGKRRSACKNAYCTHCQEATFVEGFRSFHCIHVYFIPLIPLGFMTDWRCTVCGNDPAGKRPMAGALAIAGLGAGVLGLAITFLIPYDPTEPATKWWMGGIFGLLTGGMTFILLKGNRSEYLKLKEAVRPLDHDFCPYCNTPTFQRKPIRCEECDVTIK